MNANEFRNRLEQTCRQHNFPLADLQLDEFTTYWIELNRWNSRMNLTAIRDEQEIIVKHFLDSLSVLHHFSIAPGDSVVDIGTGAGFPGIPIKIYLPDIQLTLVESSLKKVSFLRFLVSQFRLRSTSWQEVCVIAQRAEECARHPQHTHRYDWVLTRYVASIVDSVAYCTALLKPDGTWIAYKSRHVESEIQAATPQLQSLGGEVQSIIQSHTADPARTYVAIRRMKELN